MTLWAWDIECQGWDRHAVSCAVSDRGDRRVLETLEDVQDFYASTDKSDVIIAHNGGRYDMLCLLDACQAVPSWRGTLAGSALVSLRAKGYADVRDSYRLFPVSLDKWTGAKDAFPLDCDGQCWCNAHGGLAVVCGCRCKGYCAIRATGERRPGERRKLTEYCMQDCVALLDQYQTDVGRLEEIGLAVRNGRGQVRRTIGSVGWFTAAEMAGMDLRALDWTEYHHGLAAYYGGRAAVGLTAAPRGHRDDVNSMYPWALTLPVPVGEPAKLFGPSARTALRARRPGAYEATVRLPESRWPALPHRGPDRSPLDPDDRGSMLWAWGEVYGVWTHIELGAALDRGAEVVTLHSAYVYPAEEALYRPYVEHVYAHRLAAKAEAAEHPKGSKARKKAEGWAAVLKFALNAPTGKLAQRPEQCTLVVRPEYVPIPADEQISEGTGRAKRKGPRWLGGLAWVIPTRRTPQSARPIHAAVLTSRARAEKLLPRLELADEVGEAIYCDTDSVYCTVELPHGGTGLGEWGYEGAMIDWRALAPKLYRYREEESRTDVAKAKGVPQATLRDVDAFAGYLQRVEAGWTAEELAQHYGGAVVKKQVGVEGVRVAYQTTGRAFVRREILRTPRHHPRVAGTRWILDDGSTAPLERRGGLYYWGDRRADQYVARLRERNAA